MKKTLIFTMLVLSFSIFTGCSLKNAKTSSTMTKTYLNSSKTSISGNEQFVQLRNELEVTELFKVQECGDKSVYLGFGTNILKHAVGAEAYKGNGVRNNNKKDAKYWIVVPIAIPIFTAFEIISLQPLYAYKDVRACNAIEWKRKDNHLEDRGMFSGNISVESQNGNKNMNFPINNKKMPFKLSLKDENDIFSSSRKSIDSSKGYTVRINGYYIIGKEKIEVNETKIIE